MDEVERGLSWFADSADRARGFVSKVRKVADAYTALQASLAGLIELAATRSAIDQGARVKAAEPLKPALPSGGVV